jgi:type II secretory ATPase GspE/PulE/Tfp pilus assembly ATPase PilB-like protein
MFPENQNEAPNGGDIEKERQEYLRKKETGLLGQTEEKTFIQTDLPLDGDINDNVQKISFIEKKKEPKNLGSNDGNVDEYIRKMLRRAFELKATDIHIDEIDSMSRVRYRVEGILKSYGEKMLISHDFLTKRLKVMAEFFMREKEIIQKGEVNYSLGMDKKIMFTVQALPTAFSDTLLLKLVNGTKNIHVDDLGMSKFDLNVVEKILSRNSGLVIVGGMSGSGRTTTLYALMKSLRSKDVDVLSIEHKVSARIKGISQIALKDYRDLSIVELLKSISEFDVDVLVVDVELDSGVMKKLMNLSLGGKLVIVTSYFPTAYDTIIGIRSMGIETYSIAASLEGIICQQLLRRLCPSCRGVPQMKDDKKKCEVCGGSGYKGKIGVFEIFKMNRDYWQLILNERQGGHLKEAIENERNSFANNIKRLVEAKVISLEEAVRVGY